MGAHNFTTHIGTPLPYGTSPTNSGTNFSIYARETSKVSLLLYTDTGPSCFQLTPALHRTGHVWHVELRPSAAGAGYLWRVGREDSPWCTNECLDPWAVLVDTPVGPAKFNTCGGDGSDSLYTPKGIVPALKDDFDWMNVAKPKIPWHQMVVYEMHVRGFSMSAENGRVSAGSFLAVVERIPYLKSLGVNVVELLPVMEFNDSEWNHMNPNTNKPLSQYWGYSTVAFFSPMNRYGRNGCTPSDVVKDFKTMVRELHRAGIEVILDVVYNHTAEMGFDFVGRGFYGMKTLAPFSYYMLQDGGNKFVNHSGCGNTVNSNNAVVQELICSSLRYWAHTMGVDGFRFDLASVLCRDTDAEPMAKPPVVERIAKDPCMRDVKLIAEPWDCGGLYQVGTFPHHGVWAEWNGKFRDCVRRFIKGDHGMTGEFATRLCGSQDLYGAGRRPYHSVNFVTAHDGFSLHDLVAYNEKHNEQNGENNNDGEGHNNSWNCGVEGCTDRLDVVALRNKQMKNLLVALFVAAGTPMIHMGDEYGHTKHGNNNGWCQDGDLTWFDWKKARNSRDGLLRFTQKVVRLRREHTTLQHEHFLSDDDVTWHGITPNCPDWNSGYNFIALALKGDTQFFIAFNSGPEKRSVQLPPVAGGWTRVIDTNLASPKDFTETTSEKPIGIGCDYMLMEYSCIVLRQGGRKNMNMVDEVADAFELVDVKGEYEG